MSLQEYTDFGRSQCQMRKSNVFAKDAQQSGARPASVGWVEGCQPKSMAYIRWISITAFSETQQFFICDVLGFGHVRDCKQRLFITRSLFSALILPNEGGTYPTYKWIAIYFVIHIHILPGGLDGFGL